MILFIYFSRILNKIMNTLLSIQKKRNEYKKNVNKWT